MLYMSCCVHFTNTEIHVQHLFRWETSTARMELPGTLPSGWSSSSGWSTPSGLWFSAPGWISSDFWQTRNQDLCIIFKYYTKYYANISLRWKLRFLNTPIVTNTHLFSSVRQTRVSSDASLDVEVTLAVTTQVDGAWRDVDVHQVVDDPTLDVIDHPVHQVLTAHVHDLYVGQVPEAGESVTHLPSLGADWNPLCCVCVSSPVLNLVQRLVGRLVTFDPLHEILDCLLCVAVNVVWASQLHLLQERKHRERMWAERRAACCSKHFVMLSLLKSELELHCSLPCDPAHQPQTQVLIGSGFNRQWCKRESRVNFSVFPRFTA